MNAPRRFRGLHAKFSMLVVATLLLMLAVVVLMLQRQTAMQGEMTGLSRESMRALVSERLRAHGEATAVQLADLLANPLYYFDLDAIGAATRNVLHQPDVAYVIVYDSHGNVIHDGSAVPVFAMNFCELERIANPDDTTL